ncbi:putative 3-oxoadipate CoA-transferase domain protein [Mycobacteroides abscessus]|nr:putative 3-oxoadipate CoA-transferase domain protein [Mycobacteroides abscessus]
MTVVTYGGPDLGLLCSAGKVKKAYYGFVSVDSPPFYDPWFAKAGPHPVPSKSREMDEGMVKWRPGSRRRPTAVPAHSRPDSVRTS